MAAYLTIPDIVESEELQSVSAGADGVSFTVAMAIGTTAVRLMRAAAEGEHLSLVVLTMETQMIALDSVYVGDSVQSAEPPTAQFTFEAGSVRFV